MTIILFLTFISLLSSTTHADYNNDVKHVFDVHEEDKEYFIVNLVEEFELSILDDLKSQVEFEIPSSEKYKDLFKLSQKTGVISTSENGIDRESICDKEATCQVKLKVGLYKPQSMFNTFTIFVNVLDRNDHSPSFDSESSHLNIFEDALIGHNLQLTPAFDEDILQFDVQRYERTACQSIPSLQSRVKREDRDNCPFKLVHVRNEEISRDEVSLTLVRQLDYETTIGYEMTVEAFDGENKSGKLEVYVNVMDVNDNSPVFKNELYKISINESFPTSKVLLNLTATDKDSGNNGKIKYYFHHNTVKLKKNFKLNEETGELSLVKALNHKEKKEFNFKVVAQDLGIKKKSSSTNVEIRVIDINNFKPEITIMPLNQNGNVEIHENEPSFTFVFHLSVEDSDSDLNAKVSCYLNDESNFFILSKHSENNYKLLTSNVSTLDREVRSLHEVTVTCTDHGDTPLSSMKQVQIQVLDVDDNTPYFEIDEYSVNITENNLSNLLLTQVFASDADEGLNSNFKYSLCNPQRNDMFVDVDKNSGHIHSSMSFDYERIKKLAICVRADNECPNCSQQQRNIEGHSTTSATTMLIIKILDSNDNTPLFQRDFYTFEIDENSSANTHIGTVNASDIDSNSYNQFEYKILELKDDFPFEVESDSGRLKANGRAIDRELKDLYRFNILAIDSQNSSLRSKAEVSVEVLDLNDNPPAFHTNCTDVQISIDIKDVTNDPIYVCSLAVTDKDASNNSEVVVSTLKLFDVEIFSTNQTTESLYFQPEYLLQIPESMLTDVEMVVFNVTTTATDRGNPPLSTSLKDSIQLNLGNNFTVEALRVVFARRAMSSTLMIMLGAIVLSIILLTACVVVLVRKYGCEKKRKEKLSEVDTEKEFSFYESLKKSNNNNKSNNKNELMYPGNLKDRNIFMDNNSNGNQNMNFIVSKPNTNNNMSSEANNNKGYGAEEGHKHVKTDVQNKSSNSVWNKYFRKKPNQNNVDNPKSTNTTTKDAKNNIYSLVNDNPPRRQIFFNPNQSIDSRTSVAEQPKDEEPKQKFIIPTMYSTYKPNEIFYNNDARTHMGLVYSDEISGDGGDPYNDTSNGVVDRKVADDLDASTDEDKLKTYDSYSSMPRNMKLKTFFDPATNTTDNDFCNSRTLSNSSSFKNITNTHYYQ